MSKFKVGDKVRVKRSVTNPRHSWGRVVNHSSVGIITDVSGSGRQALCDFPGHSGWNAYLPEMEKVNPVLENK